MVATQGLVMEPTKEVVFKETCSGHLMCNIETNCFVTLTKIHCMFCPNTYDKGMPICHLQGFFCHDYALEKAYKIHS